MMYRIIILTVTVGLCGFVGVTLAENAQDSRQQNYVITDPNAAYDVALRYTGFDHSKSFVRKAAAEVTMMTPLDSWNGPVLTQNIVGRDVWVVRFDDIVLDCIMTGENEEMCRRYPPENYPRTFDVYIDPETGMFLKAISRFTGDSTEPNFDRWKEVPSAMNMEAPDFEKLAPDTLPATSMLGALTSEFFMPMLAEEIEIFGPRLVSTSDGDVPTWWIILKRIGRETWFDICVVDASGGKHIMSMSKGHDRSSRRWEPVSKKDGEH